MTTFSATHIDTMTSELDEVASGGRNAPDVTCVMGQIVLAVA